ncbi:MAG: ABC transporter ATP-binding protein [Planctomycetota bacterium]|nr:ABC transporter ATP-binding protein [Planctomycetota bacterium]
MKPAIHVDALSKLYRIGAASNGQYRTLRESLADAVTGPFRRLKSLAPTIAVADGTNGDGAHAPGSSTAPSFWALRDVGFEVQPGEVIGIIGRNGAGKSTLLKILSRITEPTTGRIELRGRIASLLEVGTGFHPELTGRENIFLNGSILGMSRREIASKFDEIVDFAEIEMFLNTPVKRYSSGMYVRLAFAVAAHLEPEILIIDEVLAVGDSAFQKKCLGKMQDVAKHGRTVLFVSHNMAAVQNLCQGVILLDQGRVRYVGPTAAGVSQYLSSNSSKHDGFVSLVDHPARAAGGEPLLQSVRFLNADGEQASSFAVGDPFTVEFELDPRTPLRQAEIGIGFNSVTHGRVFSVGTFLSDRVLSDISEPSVIRCQIEQLCLVPGRYSLSLSAGTHGHKLLDNIEDAVYLDVEASDFYGNGTVPMASLGHVAVRSKWEVLSDERLA